MKKGRLIGDPFSPRVRSAALSRTETPALASALLATVLHPFLHTLLRCIELRALLSREEVSNLSLLLLMNRLNPRLHVGAEPLKRGARSRAVALLAQCPSRIALSPELFASRLEPGTIFFVNRANLSALRVSQIQVTSKSAVETSTAMSPRSAHSTASLSVRPSLAWSFNAGRLSAGSLRAGNPGNSNKQCSSKSRSIPSRHQNLRNRL